MSKPPPTETSPITKESASQAANSIRVPRATRPRRRGNSLPPTRRTLGRRTQTRRTQTRRPDFEFRQNESKHPNATRKSCCERWFGRRGSKKRKKKCKKKCKTRKKKRKKMRKKRTRRK